MNKIKVFHIVVVLSKISNFEENIFCKNGT